MAVQIVSDTIGVKFSSLLEECRNDLFIISPFIGKSTASALAKHLERLDGFNCTIITRYYREDFISGVSSLYGLELLLNAGA
ncbi:hypothetical protein ACFCW7_24090 [Paenibacillus glucanolyticus]|uniref:hypothetical protein n=1 Tax=Paenibacillus glucanolyticus TaxID=59843 RepID=UPI001CE15E28|nr:hypothetical protein [Mycolicibacterium fortuitum]